MLDITKIPRMETHAHSWYSNIRLIDSINDPKKMIQHCADIGLKGCVLTDHEALCGHVVWLNAEKELKEKGTIPKDFKCGLGNEIYLVEERKNKQKYYHFILIAKDAEGYKALSKLSSQAWYNLYFDGMERVPTLYSELEEVMKECKGHVIGATACLASHISTLVLDMARAVEENEDDDVIYEKKLAIVELINRFKNIFGEDDFYLECAPGRSKEQLIYNANIRNIAKATNTKLIFACDAHYLKKEDRAVHKAFLNSKEGEREVDAFYAYSHFQDNEEAWGNLNDIFTEEEFSEMCANSMEIYDKIGEYNIFHNPIIPHTDLVAPIPKYDYDLSDYPTMTMLTTSSNEQKRYWSISCLNALKELEDEDKLFDTREVYLQRLETEGDVIETIGQKLGNVLFEYFNTYRQYIDLFWECGSMVGPGRGSSTGFLSNYLLGITQLDPIKWKLNWWRFLNKERLELPDVDTDLAPTKRPLILKKIREERGETKVLQVATFGTETSRSAVKTACRGYRSEECPDGIDIDTADYLTSLIPEERGFVWPLHDVVYGNEKDGRKPIKAFVQTIKKYDGLLDIMLSIEGVISRRGIHASGVIFYNDEVYNTNAIMRAPNGDLTTQLELHDSEKRGDVKFDMLLTEVCDKLTKAIELLHNDGYFKECDGFRDIYNKYFHPNVLNVKDPNIWESLENNTTMDVFQFNSAVGAQVAYDIKPKNPIEMTLANALMRLQGEKGKERPEDRYIRMKNDLSQWYEEMRVWGLTDEEVKTLEPYYKEFSGCPLTQESLMEVCMDKNIAGFTLSEANQARKIVAKKQIAKVPELKEKFVSSCPRRVLGEYVWETTMAPQMSYSFSINHALAYSFVGIQTLVMNVEYPSVYWQCACLIINSGGEENAEDDKKKNKSSKYGKVAKALGEMQNEGVSIVPPSINYSDMTFKPNKTQDGILYGLKGITNVGNDYAHEIINHRPYASVQDFEEKVKSRKPQIISLIKAGAFDEFGDRIEIMKDFILKCSDQKKRITMQNFNMMLGFDMIPDEFDLQRRVFNFDKYLKSTKINKDLYKLDENSFPFYEEYGDVDYVNTDNNTLTKSHWKPQYDELMAPVKPWVKENAPDLLVELNNKLFKQEWDKYCEGSISKWEMDSICYYNHEHELAHLNMRRYGISNFFRLNETPTIERSFKTRDGAIINMLKINRICGTVIDKNKNKGLVTLLTTTGVVTIRIYKDLFAKYDKRISEMGVDGHRHLVEDSWFTRGTKIVVCGIRQGANFVAKKYKSTPYHLVEKIIALEGDMMVTVTQRADEVSDEIPRIG